MRKLKNPERGTLTNKEIEKLYPDWKKTGFNIGKIIKARNKQLKLKIT